ncbi:MAG: recombinase family protein, partial [Rikenellaceae bacterium]|nr:recombinase family protein [Rikenellaceae bacterium]
MSNNTFVRYDFGKNCVCVGRTSTLEQSTTAQIRDLEKFANDMGYENVQPFFTSESGFIEYDDKQGWNQVVDFFEQNPDYRVLIVPEISRLSRKESILFKIKDYLIAKKIQLIIKDINFVLFNEWGEIPKGNDIVFSLYASLANSEMAQKKERFRRALKDYRLQGYAIGGKELFGYTRYYEMFNGKNRSRYKINDVEAAEIKQVYHWYAYGIDGDLRKTSILAITRECIARGFSKYLHSKRNVNKCLKEEAYSGQKQTHNRIKNPEYWNYNKKNEPKYIDGQSFVCVYPPIFSGESMVLFNRVRERLIENNTRFSVNVPVDKSRKHTTILSRLIPCPNCGSFLTGEYRMRKDGTQSFSYRCNQSRGVLNKCEYTSLISMRLLDSVVWGYCQNEIFRMIEQETSSNCSTKICENEVMIENLQKKIDEFDYNGKIDREDAILRRKLDIVKGDAIEHAYEIYADKIKKIEKQFEDLTKNVGRRIDELKRENESLSQLTSFRDAIKQLELIAESKDKLYEYIHKLVKHVEIVYNHRYHSIIRIHLLGQDTSEYIYIYKRSTLNIR